MESPLLTDVGVERVIFAPSFVNGDRIHNILQFELQN
jgi:hypothetical protein